MSRGALHLQDTKRLADDLARTLPKGWAVVRVIVQEVAGTEGNINPEDQAAVTYIASNHDLNIVLEGRIGWLVRMAQKYSFGELA